MKPLAFTLKKIPTNKLDCRVLTPNKLAGQSIEKISKIYINKNYQVQDFFDISGEDSQNIIFKKSNNHMVHVGHKMSQGQITIEDNCGDFLGANMQGGSIICNGNAGDRIGDQMRRGLILIDGNTGDYCGSRMLAGTIGVYGKVGKYAGFAMKRGTILLKNQADFHATIQDCGTHNLPFLALLFQSFKPLTTKFKQIKSYRAQRFAGDLANNGNGEILVISA